MNEKEEKLAHKLTGSVLHDLYIECVAIKEHGFDHVKQAYNLTGSTSYALLWEAFAIKLHSFKHIQKAYNETKLTGKPLYNLMKHH